MHGPLIAAVHAYLSGKTVFVDTGVYEDAARLELHAQDIAQIRFERCAS